MFWLNTVEPLYNGHLGRTLGADESGRCTDVLNKIQCMKRPLYFPSKHRIVVFHRVTLACDHALSLYLCNLFSGAKEAEKQKKRPDLGCDLPA